MFAHYRNLAAFFALVLLVSFSGACTSSNGNVTGDNGDSDSLSDSDIEYSGPLCNDDSECSQNEVCYGNHCIAWEENPCFSNGECVSEIGRAHV